MDSNNQLKDKPSENVDLKSSIADFLRELEEKEKDLNISEEMIIEIDEDAISEDEFPEFLKADFPNAVNNSREIPYAPVTSIEPVQAVETFGSEHKNQSNDFQNQIKELKKIIFRGQMDFDNYRKRVERERSESFQNQISNLAVQMLPVLDNLNRALDAASHFGGEQSRDFQQFFDGIALVNQQLNEILNEMGVQPLKTVGEPFNPHFHDAVATELTNNFPPNTITQELLRGYRLGDKLIRAAMVKVASPAE